MIEPSTIIAIAAETFFALVALLAANAGRRCIAQDSREELGQALFRSITKTTWILGPLLLITVLVLFRLGGPSGDTGGIMSRDMGLFVICIGVFLVLLLFWASAITLGFIAAKISRGLSPMAAVAVIFGVLALSPLFCAGNFLGNGANQQRAAWKTGYGP